jgi:FlaA1/EpsC-like NDP-sugar epimerase
VARRVAQNLPCLRTGMNWRSLGGLPTRRRALALLSHVALTTLGYAAAFAIRYDLTPPPDVDARFLATLPYLIGIRLVLAYRFRLDRRYWQHVSLSDALHLTAAISLGSLLFPVTLFLFDQLYGLPMSIFVLDWILALGLTGGVRLAARALRERLPRGAANGELGPRTFVVGAGEAGEQLLRQILHDRRRQFCVVGLIDDDPGKLGQMLHGVPVVGTIAELRGLVALYRVTHALIAIPSATPEQHRRLVESCVAEGLEVKLLPPLQDLIAGDVHLAQVRDVEIEDLLGRAPVELDAAMVEPLIAGKVVLVTGAGGSIGAELARQLAQFHPLRLVLLERAESPLYYVQIEIQRTHPAVDVVPVLASVTNGERLDRIFDSYKPDLVFHAAAYKHVPMLERDVAEGVWNNVLGTLKLARAAARTGTHTFVLISTDKAVNPTSVLGATKRVAERIVLELPSLRASGTDFRVVRFGNVLGSDGSVVPLFKKQLAAGGPITVTHPEMKRYFMTIPEAVQLVLQAAGLPECAGRIALLEMGTQIKILDLAENLIRLSGRVPHSDVPIVFTGLRPGEKLEEELVAASERAVPTSLDKIRVVERDGTSGEFLAERIRQLIRATAKHDESALFRALTALVPEYLSPLGAMVQPSGNGNGHARRNGRQPGRPAARIAPPPAPSKRTQRAV